MADQDERFNDVLRYVRPDTGANEMALHTGDPALQEPIVALYITLVPDKNGVNREIPTIVYRATLTDAQRRAIADGEDIYVQVQTYGKAPQPTTLQVGPGGLLLQSQLLDTSGERISLDPAEEKRPTFEAPKLWTPDQGAPE